jgi:hypothetical protein
MGNLEQILIERIAPLAISLAIFAVYFKFLAPSDSSIRQRISETLAKTIVINVGRIPILALHITCVFIGISASVGYVLLIISVGMPTFSALVMPLIGLIAFFIQAVTDYLLETTFD